MKPVPFATYCGIILDNGNDCDGAVAVGSPINLCNRHFRQAAEWVHENDDTVHEMVVCGLCGEHAAVPGATGYRCEHCGYQMPDLTGPTRLTAAEERLLRPPATKVEVVYYLAFSDRVKIGTSTNIRRRLLELQYDAVLALERGGRQLEQSRHAQFGAHRVTGEWFRRHPELDRHINSLIQPGGWEKQLREWEGKAW